MGLAGLSGLTGLSAIMGDGSAGVEYSPSLDFGDALNSGYIALIDDLI